MVDGCKLCSSVKKILEQGEELVFELEEKAGDEKSPIDGKLVLTTKAVCYERALAAIRKGGKKKSKA